LPTRNSNRWATLNKAPQPNSDYRGRALLRFTLGERTFASGPVSYLLCMDIIWFGRSCFRIQSGQAILLTDPVDLPPDTPFGTADIVTISDRAFLDRMARVDGARVIDGPGEYEIKGVPVTGIATVRSHATDGAGGVSRHNFVYSLVLDNIAICHLGRLSEMPVGARAQDIGAPDVLLIPLGEPSGLNAARAVQFASQLEAKLLIPMLLGGPNDQTTLESFCRELGADPTAVESRISVSASGLAAQTRVVVLAPRTGQSGG
jgi:L-ascorbate metabolism protein UlaG (beta-lactamase superfamily)